MSFSADLKNEILDNKPIRLRFKQAQAYGLFAFSKSFSETLVETSTASPGTAKLFEWFLKEFLGRGTKITLKEKAQNGKTVYNVKLEERRDCARLYGLFDCKANKLNTNILPTPAHVQAFLSGVYLACGHITDPQKSYHVEFVVRAGKPGEALNALLDEHLPGAKSTLRRGSLVIYYKEYAQIEDLLTFMGASKSCLAMIDVEMIKSVRNGANRATNCETANIDKTVEAAAGQIEDIRLVIRLSGAEALPDGLRAVAKLRLENPDASLRELAELSEPKMSRSGIYHRLDKLSRMAVEIRRENGETR